MCYMSMDKRVLNFVQKVFFLLSTEGSEGLLALYLGGTPSQRTGTKPPCLFLKNRLHMLTRQSSKSQIVYLLIVKVKLDNYGFKILFVSNFNMCTNIC